jgi:hypothetical protein
VIRRCKCRHVQTSHRLGECSTCNTLARYSIESRPTVCRGFDEAYCRCWHVTAGHDPITGECQAVGCTCEGVSLLDELDELVRYNEIMLARAKHREEVREKAGFLSPATSPCVYVPSRRPVWE